MGANFWLYDRFFPHMVSTFSPPLRIPQSTMDTLNAGIDILSKLASLYFIVLPSLSNFGPLPLPRRCISLIACRKQTSPPTPHMKNFSNTNSPPPNFGYLGVYVFPGFAHTPPINYVTVHVCVSFLVTHLPKTRFSAMIYLPTKSSRLGMLGLSSMNSLIMHLSPTRPL